jgi:ribosome-associated protein
MSEPVRDKRFVKKVIRLLEDKKAENIRAYDLKPINPFVDYTVVATAMNEPQLRSLEQAVHEAGPEARSEGLSASGWMIVDVGRVVVHLLSPAKREFYRLDALWDEHHLELQT